MVTTYSDILSAEGNLTIADTFRDRVNEIMAAAEDNASTYSEGTHDKRIVDSIVCCLSFETDKAVIAWFANLGITA